VDAIETIDIESWLGPYPAAVGKRAVAALERGKVLLFPRLRFPVEDGEQPLFSAAVSNGKAKNVSFDPLTQAVQGTVLEGGERDRLRAMMERFGQTSARFMADLFPSYAPAIERARTSFRPVEVLGRHYSLKKDDRLLHVDAFPSRPTQGQRILRLFSNVDPGGNSRVWHVGEPFEDFARKFLPKAKPPIVFQPWLLAAFGITSGRRSKYDHLMLELHDRGKLDAEYQRNAPRDELAFPAGSTWLCYTDQVLHAALGGQFAFEQTFHVDIHAMTDPSRSPLRVLERMTGQALV
jgi:3-deoxy-D-manno-oct-2-ulosonic acid (Kdo) hydroxylase